MTVAYRDQIMPVAANAIYDKQLETWIPKVWVGDSFSAGRFKSASPAMTSAHFWLLKKEVEGTIVGAQKWTVLGPAGWLRNDWRRVDAIFLIFDCF